MKEKERYQARPEKTIPFSEEVFSVQEGTSVYWMGAAGVLVNSRGTTIMMDPVLETLPEDNGRSEIFGKTLLAPPPVTGAQVKKMDAVLYTHADEDHMGLMSARALLPSGAVYHATPYTAKQLREGGIPSERICEHTHHSVFDIGNVLVRMTGAFHPHQLGNPVPGRKKYFTVEDCTGFRLETADGIVWNPGDTILMEEHLQNTDADLVLMDFGDNEHHFGRKLSIQLANALSASELLMYHWGTVYAPDESCFNADPKDIYPYIQRRERLHVLAPGEKYVLRHR